MEKEGILLLAQLLASMKEATARLGEAVKNQDAEHVAEVKRELLRLQEKIDHVL